MAHTPGPYRTGSREQLILDLREGIPNKKMFHTVQARIAGTAFSQAIGYFRNEGDAQLFAAAPDLLAALEACRGLVLDQLGRESTRPHNHDLAQRVQAAIAKAKGQV